MSSSNRHLIKFGPYTFDCDQGELICGKELIELPSRTAAVLEYLILNRGRFVSAEELMHRLWPKLNVERNTIDQHISAIRAALADSPRTPLFIKTKYKGGWQFVAAVTQTTDSGENARPDSPSESRSKPDSAEEMIQPESVALTQSSPVLPINQNRRPRILLLFCLAAAAMAGVTTLMRVPASGAGRILNSIQLTDGKAEIRTAPGKWLEDPLCGVRRGCHTDHEHLRFRRRSESNKNLTSQS